ncbi:Group 4 capsule polysaccharide lipoprotein gfcB, YjbF [Tranquillimonas rosea]|uniref:Group 4 capsule polysaccharide lipoprotein gfcB, YjbF n=2 Tax=Tranquillimonas rosea TaxID=641238 RepID=A0A1H9WCF4_9RHOB|nr:Group 4 capsule polysaccharide lipoprotein gfcB, YjbF [Tranquillimonas rosea]
MTTMRLVGALAAVATLTACGSGDDQSLLGEAGDAVRGAISGPDAPPRVTTPPEVLRNFESPVLLLELNRVDGSALVGLVATNGRSTTWESSDERTITIRNGQLAATRGFGEDLMSADLPEITADARGRVVRDHYYLRGDEQTARSRYFCTLTSGGSTRVQVLDRTYPADIVYEDCEGEDGSFRNTYWFKPSGAMQKVEQYVSDAVGTIGVVDVQN